MADIEIIKGADNGNPPDTLRQMYPKINRNFQKVNAELTGHIGSTVAHKAEDITYSGLVPGGNVKVAVDNLNTRVSEIVAQSGDDITELVDARDGYEVLGDRLNASDQRLADLAFNVKRYITINDAVQAASVAGGKLLFPPGTYLLDENITVPSNVTLEFTNGSTINIASNIIFTINGYIEAGYYQLFTGSGLVEYNAKNADAFPEWWGAKADGVTNDSTAIQRSITACRVLSFRPATYFVGSKITIPQNKFITLKGSGYRQTTFLIASNIVGFEFIRDPSVGGAILQFNSIEFVENGLGQTSYALSYSGVSLYHDNALRMNDCSFYGFERAVYLTFCGGVQFISCYAQLNNVVYFLERDASNVTWDNCFNLNNGNFIYADDQLADGLSNGLIINNSSSIYCSGADIRIIGWQAVYIRGGSGYDFGGAEGSASIYLGKCMDFTIDSVYISPDNYGNTNNALNRNCIKLEDCHSGVISGNSLYNAGEISIAIINSTSRNSALTIRDNIFNGSGGIDIFFSAGIGIVVEGNKFLMQMPRTGTLYEIYANTPGTNYNIIKNNIFVGSSYTITAGANSIVGDNIFGAPYIV